MLRKTLPIFFFLINIFFLPAYSLPGFSGPSKNSSAKLGAKKWVEQEKPLGFQENKGQMSGMDNKPAGYVLFKAEIPDLNIWVTTSGLTYQFFTIEKKELKNSDGNLKVDHNGKPEKEKKTRWHRVDMSLKGASIKKENIVTEGNITQGNTSYYLAHCPNGIFNVNSYTKITIKEVYPGIDWVLYTSANGGENLKYDFVVHPGADPGLIKLIYEGSGKFDVRNGRIYFENKLGSIHEGELLCYQGSEVIEANYGVSQKQNLSLNGKGIDPLPDNADEMWRSKKLGTNDSVFSCEVGVDIKKYDRSKPLIIDPQLVWNTFYGGNGADGPMGIDCDQNGNVFIVGYLSTSNFPVQTWGSAYYDPTFQGVVTTDWDAFIMQFSNAGALVWSTYYGGTGNEEGNSIALDKNGNIYVTGKTGSTNLPLQAKAGAYNQPTGGGTWDEHLFILCFSNTGVRNWATYYGGSGNENTMAVSCDSQGNVYVCGFTQSTNFPTQALAGSYNQASSGGGVSNAFILKFTSTGARVWATYYGGNNLSFATSLTCDSNDNLLVTGYVFTANTSFPVSQAWSGAYNQAAFGGGTQDGFILRFTSAGALTWATFYGGTANERPTSVLCDGNNNIYITGSANAGLPTQNWAGAYNQAYGGGLADAFILRFTNTGVYTWGTYYGGSGNESHFGGEDDIAIDNCDNVYVAFETASANTPTYAGCNSYLDAGYGGGTKDQFIVKVNKTGERLWATYFGGNGIDPRAALAVDNDGNLFITGEWSDNSAWVGVQFSAATYPLTNPGGGAYFDNIHDGGIDDGFIAKFIPTPLTITPQQLNPSGCSTCNGSATASIVCGEPNFTYQWSNGSTASGTTSTISGLCSGVYSVTVADASCKIQKANLNYSLSGGGGAAPTFSINSTAAICNNNNGTASALNVTGGTGPYIYSWNGGQTTATVTGLSPGTYTVTVTNSSGCSSASAIVVANMPCACVNPPVLNLNSTNTYCNNSAGTASVSINGGTGTGPFQYLWSNLNTSTAITNLFAGIYSVTVTDAANCSAVVTATIISNPSVTTSTISPTTCGSYTGPAGRTYTVTNTYSDTLTNALGCDSIITIQLTVGTTVVVNQNVPSGCDSVNYNGAWYNTTQIISDTVFGGSFFGCDSITNTQLTVKSGSGSTINPSACSSYTSPGGSSYTISGIYTETVSGGNYQGCDSVITINLTILPAVSSNNSISSCDSANIHNKWYYTSQQVIDTLQTSPGCDSIVTTALTIYRSSVSVSNLDICEGETISIHGRMENATGIYTHTFSGIYGCDSISAVTLAVQAAPVASFTATPQPATLSSSAVYFTDMSLGANYWYWSFGDANNSSSSIQHPSYAYSDTGHYLVRLVAMGASGCSDTLEQIIVVEGEYEIFVPNTFTPNGDGVNDLFLPLGVGITAEDYAFYVFDRWGNLIFKSTDPNIGWDGRANGGKDIAQIDTYVWKAYARDAFKTNHRYVGHINLVR